jgi:hypothetical protein
MGVCFFLQLKFSTSLLALLAGDCHLFVNQGGCQKTKYVLEFVSYIITFLQTKMAAQFLFTKGLYLVVLNYQFFVVQKATRTQFKLKYIDAIVNSLSR